MRIIYRSPNSDEEFENYFNFRWQQLRKPLGFKQGSERDDLEEDSFQIAAFNNQVIIGTGRLQINPDNSARIRYMAVEETFRKQGIGGRILANLETIANENNVTNCWLLARENATGFYLKNNYKIIGKAKSELPIPHVRMQKVLAHN